MRGASGTVPWAGLDGAGLLGAGIPPMARHGLAAAAAKSDCVAPGARVLPLAWANRAGTTAIAVDPAAPDVQRAGWERLGAVGAADQRQGPAGFAPLAWLGCTAAALCGGGGDAQGLPVLPLRSDLLGPVVTGAGGGALQGLPLLADQLQGGVTAFSTMLGNDEVCMGIMWLTEEMRAGVFASLLRSATQRRTAITFVPGEAANGSWAWKAEIEYDSFFEQYMISPMAALFERLHVKAGDRIAFRPTHIGEAAFTVWVLPSGLRAAATPWGNVITASPLAPAVAAFAVAAAQAARAAAAAPVAAVYGSATGTATPPAVAGAASAVVAQVAVAAKVATAAAAAGTTLTLVGGPEQLQLVEAPFLHEQVTGCFAHRITAAKRDGTAAARMLNASASKVNSAAGGDDRRDGAVSASAAELPPEEPQAGKRAHRPDGSLHTAGVPEFGAVRRVDDAYHSRADALERVSAGRDGRDGDATDRERPVTASIAAAAAVTRDHAPVGGEGLPPGPVATAAGRSDAIAEGSGGCSLPDIVRHRPPADGARAGLRERSRAALAALNGRGRDGVGRGND